MVSCLVRQGDEVVIQDIEAGIEPLSVGNAMEAGFMLAVLKSRQRSAKTAQSVQKRSANLGIRRFAVKLSR
jgi:CO dehydrogenase nickel-insertion accessory protein CooC1